MDLKISFCFDRPLFDWNLDDFLRRIEDSSRITLWLTDVERSELTQKRLSSISDKSSQEKSLESRLEVLLRLIFGITIQIRGLGNALLTEITKLLKASKRLARQPPNKVTA